MIQSKSVCSEGWNNAETHTRRKEGVLGKCRNGGRLVARDVDELVVNNLNLAVVAGKLNNLVGDSLGLGEARDILAHASEAQNNVLRVGAGQLGSALLAEDHQVEVGVADGLTADVAGKARVDATAEALVGAADHDELLLALALVGLGLGRRVHLVAGLPVLARLGHAALSTCQFGGSHDLHRLGDLLDVANRLEAALDFSEGRIGGRGARCCRRSIPIETNPVVSIAPNGPRNRYPCPLDIVMAHMDPIELRRCPSLPLGRMGDTYRDEAAAPALKAGRAALDSILRRCAVCEEEALSAGCGPDCPVLR